MSPKDSFYQHCQHWFNTYADSYIRQAADLDRPGFELKRLHTLKVVEESLWLAEHCRFTLDEQAIAGVIGLLHDVGRFPQLQRYRTFNDRLSCNHAALSLSVIQEKRLLKELSPPDRQAVETAVIWHNQKDLPSALPPRLFQFAGLIRDADKLDIFRVLLTEYATGDPARIQTVDLDLPEGEDCSDTLLDAIAAGRMGDAADVHSRLDLHLVRLSWVFVFHNPAALRRFHEHAFIDQYRPYLPATPRIGRALSLLQQYVAAHIGQ